MGNSQSEYDKSKELSRVSKEKIIQENLLQQERIKNQLLESKLQSLQTLIQTTKNENNLLGRSSNQLLTNPNLQNEFFKNKRMQKEFFEMVLKQKSEQIDQEQYQQINDFLKNLDLNEEIDNNKHLYMNESSHRYNTKQDEEKMINIGNDTNTMDKYLRELKRQKEQQMENMKQEQKIRKEEYQSKMNNGEEQLKDPYKILQISPNSSFSDCKKAFRRMARIYHPDKFNGNDTQFKIITKAFMIIVDKYKKAQTDKQFNSLRDESRKALNDQLNNSKRHINLDFTDEQISKNNSGRNFNEKLFNKVFQDNRLYNPTDEGYKKWMEENEFDSDKNPKMLGSFNKNNFHNKFQEIKSKKSQAITKYIEPQALPSLKQNYEELGQGNIEDFSGRNDSIKRGVQYTDYRKAHTETTLIDPDSINYREYSSLDDLQQERSKKTFLTKEEQEVIQMNKLLEEQREAQRIDRLSKNDDRHFKHFQKVNQMMINR